MAALGELPWRGPGPDRPSLPLPPARMPVRFAGTTRKRWRYVAAFSEGLILCAARVGIGPIGQTFWAIVDRSRGELIERTRTRLPGGRGEVWSELPGGEPWPLGGEGEGLVTRVESRRARARLRIGRGRWVESICPNGGGGYVWTRKRCAPIEVDLRLPDGRRWRLAARGIEDESAGYHPRHTVWSWSAGIGVAGDGREVGWNLVAGVNDPAERSERAVWVDGEPFEPGPVSFEGLEAIGFEDGSRLAFEAEAERCAEQDLIAVRSSYRQPFGTFAGRLAGIELASATGVMEHHDALW